MRHDPEFVKELARDMGVSRRTAKRGLHSLIETGYLALRDGYYVATLPNGKSPADEARDLLGRGPDRHSASHGDQ